MSRARELAVRIKGYAEGFDKATQTAREHVGKIAETSERVKGRVERAFDSVAGAVWRAGKRIVQVGIAGTIGAIALSLKRGWDRLTGIENARASLEGLGHSGAEVDSIMKAALGSVKGTAFGMDEAASTAATLVAGTGKQGKELERIMSIVADTAVIGKTSMSDMGAIFNKVAGGVSAMGTQGRVTTEVMNQLTDRGIGGFAILAEHLDVTQAKVREMVTRGEIDFETFAAAMEGKMGGAAQKAGDTVQGALANVGAAFGRIGANVLSGAFAQLPGLFKSVQGWLEPLEDKATALGEALGVWLTESGQKLRDGFERLRPSLDKLAEAGGKLWGALGTVVEKVREATSSAGRVDVWGSLESVIGRVTAGVEAMAGWFDRNADSIAAAVRWGRENTGILKGLLGVVLAVVAGIKAYNIAKSAWLVLTKGWTIAVKAAAIAQRAFNLVLRANPIMLIITGIVLLVAGLIKLYKENETFRRIVDRVWAAIKGAILTVVDWFRNTAIPWLQEAWEKAKSGFSSIWETVKRVWDNIKSGVRTGIDFVVKLFLNFTGPGLIIKHWDTIMGAFRGAWTWIKGTFASWWDTITSILRKPVDMARTAIDGILGTDGIQGVFTRARDGIGRIWDGIKEKLSGPIDWVKKNVINPFLQAIKDFLNGIKATDLAAKIRLLPVGPGGSAAVAGAGALPGRAGGGRIPGRWDAARRDHVLGVDHLGRPTSRVEPGEMVVRYASTRAIDRRFPGYLDALNSKGPQAVMEMHGPLPRLAGGGRVKPVPQGHSGWNGGRYRSSGRWHGGVDYASPYGTPVKAAATGTVSHQARLASSYGHHIWLQHSDSWRTLYAHLSAILTRVGQAVSAGQVIGRVGSTGNSTGPHLHFEARHHGRQVNPDSFLAGASYGAPVVTGSATASSGIEKLVDAIVEPILNKISNIGGGWFGEAMGRMPHLMYDGIKAEIKKLVFDQGGMLPRGFTLTENRTGRPERVLNEAQWQALTARDDVEVTVYVQVPGGEFKRVAREEARVEVRRARREKAGAL